MNHGDTGTAGTVPTIIITAVTRIVINPECFFCSTVVVAAGEASGADMFILVEFKAAIFSASIFFILNISPRAFGYSLNVILTYRLSKKFVKSN